MPYRDTEGQENHVAACGAPGEWPDVDFGALVQGRRRQSSLIRSFSTKLCKGRDAYKPYKNRDSLLLVCLAAYYA